MISVTPPWLTHGKIRDVWVCLWPAQHSHRTDSPHQAIKAVIPVVSIAHHAPRIPSVNQQTLRQNGLALWLHHLIDLGDLPEVTHLDVWEFGSHVGEGLIEQHVVGIFLMIVQQLCEEPTPNPGIVDTLEAISLGTIENKNPCPPHALFKFLPFLRCQ